MLISMAYAQEVAIDATEAVAEAPSAANAFAWNMGLILILVVMFYVLLIRPQQKRFAEHRDMLGALKKGDRVVTSGGLIGKIDKLAGDDEVIIDLGGGTKVTAVRSTIQAKADNKADNKTDKAAPKAEEKKK